MRTRRFGSIPQTSALLAGLLAPAVAHAQLDIEPPLPNVLLLIDSSGSMEHMANGTDPVCQPGTATPLNRWATLLTVMTGTIQGYSCDSINRNSNAFKNEYLIGGLAPYDFGYYLPYHRPLSNGCAIAPGALPSPWSQWPVSNGFAYHPYNNAAGSCTWSPAYDGVLDVFADRARFGLMTFDSFPDASTGVVGNAFSASDGLEGMWSYYANWQSGGSASMGQLPQCQAKEFEVGARNQAAPPWEGRFVPFGPYDESGINAKARNDFIQQELLAMRPYGATPIAGMLKDASDFLRLENGKENNKDIGPHNDPYVQGGCRKNYVILLSDGEPNLDLRNECAGNGGSCPYQLPHEIAHDLFQTPNPSESVKVFAIGFGLSSSGNVSCANINPATAFSGSGECVNPTGAVKACCALHRVAYEGGTTKAYFADDVTTLKAALNDVLGQVTQGSTSRTLPTFAPASSASGSGNANAPAAAYQFVSSFELSGGSSLWRGNLERKRYVCKSGPGGLFPELQDVDTSKGDRFSDNVNSNDSSRVRKFFSYAPYQSSSGNSIVYYSERSLRPFAVTDEGLGAIGQASWPPQGSVGGPTVLLNGSQFGDVFSSYPELVGVSPTALPSYCQAVFQTSSAQECARRVVRYHVGEVTPGVPVTRDVTACAQGKLCSEFGSVYHSTPAVIGAPHEFLRDESYSAFAQDTLVRNRPLMLYTATTDGQLHAFKVAPGDANDNYKVDTLSNNELWSFMPPSVLPRLPSAVEQQALLLDGPPVVRDIVLRRDDVAAQNGGAVGVVDPSTWPPQKGEWRTVLVGAGGSAGGFYYALEITNPNSPRFLWQLSTDGTGSKLFGRSTPAPAIATLAVRVNGKIEEVAVALLAGGSNAVSNGLCNRQQKDTSHLQPNAAVQPRAAVRCWDSAGVDGPGRTLTVVRIDTGEVLMHFRAAANEGPAALLAQGRAKVVPFDSPLTGVPAAFPGRPGEVANRAYVGDADGTLWRVDLSSPDPQNWKVDIAWDGYGLNGDDSMVAEPIQTAPIVSLDPVGNSVILFASGDQDRFFDGNTAISRVWSLTEKLTNGQSKISDNWNQQFNPGVRVTGPLTLFNSTLYFSTFTPNANSAAACANGFGSIWGIDYRQTLGAAGVTPAVPRLANDPQNPAAGYSSHQDFPDSLVFGVGVTQTPACYATETFNDPYLGGSRTAISSVGGGNFQLVFQTGKNSGQNANQAKTKTQTVDLPRPRETTRVDSWASAVE